MFKGSNRKMFRKPGMARRAIGILASSPDIMQAANRNMPVRLQGGGDPLFEQARQQARFMLSRPGVSYNMNEDQMTQSIYQNLLRQNQPISRTRPESPRSNLTRQEQINQTIQAIFGSNFRGPEQFTTAGAFDTRPRQAAGQEFVSRNPATSADTQPFALNRDLGDQMSLLDMDDAQLKQRQAELLNELKNLENRPGGLRKDPLTRQGVRDELEQISKLRESVGRDISLMKQIEDSSMPDGGIKGIKGALEFKDKPLPEYNFTSAEEIGREKTKGLERSEGISKELQDIADMFKGSLPDASGTLDRKKARENVAERKDDFFNITPDSKEGVMKRVADLQAQGKPIPPVLRRRYLKILKEGGVPEIEGKDTPDAQGKDTPDAQGKRTPDAQSKSPPDAQSKDTPDAQGTNQSNNQDGESDPKRDVEIGAETALKDGETVSLAKQILADMNQPPELAEQKDFWHYVTLAGLGMASGKSGDALSNVADGLLVAFNQKTKDDEKFQDNKYKRFIDQANIKYKQIELLLDAEGVDQQRRLNEARAFEATSKGKYYEQYGITQNAPDAKEKLSLALRNQYGLTESEANLIAYSDEPLIAESRVRDMRLVKESETAQEGEIFSPFNDGKFFVFKSGVFKPAREKDIKRFRERQESAEK